MALDGNIENSKQAPEVKLSSINLNSVSDMPASAKPVQVAQNDDGVFNRNRGQGQPGTGRAHPFGDGTSVTPTTGKPLEQPTGQQPSLHDQWNQHVQEQQPKLDALGNTQQAQVHAAADRTIKGNAVAVGFADNAFRAKSLEKDWDLIGVPTGIDGFSATAGRVLGVGLSAAALRAVMRKSAGHELESIKPVGLENTKKLGELEIELAKRHGAVENVPAKSVEAKEVKESRDFLSKLRTETPQGGHTKFVDAELKNHSNVFSAAEKQTISEWAANADKQKVLAERLEGGKYRGMYTEGKSGMWAAAKAIGVTSVATWGLGKAIDQLPGDHTEAHRILGINTTEMFGTGLIAAAPMGSNKLKAGLIGANWLLGREEKMTTTEALGTTAAAVVGTFGASLISESIPKAVTAFVPKFMKLEGEFGLKKAAVVAGVEVGAFVLSRVIDATPLGSKIPELQNASTSAWNSMKNDSDKMSGSSLRSAVSSFDDLGQKWRGVLTAYTRDIMGDSRVNPHSGITGGSLPIKHGDTELSNYQNIITNSRTGLVLSEATGNTFLKSGLTEDTQQDLLGKFMKTSKDQKPQTDNILLAPNQGDLDLTGRASRAYMQALGMADVTTANMKAAQGSNEPIGQNISDSDISAVTDEKAKVQKVLSEQIFRSSPGAEAHDIKSVVEDTGAGMSAHKFTLTDYAKHDQTEYQHMINALEDKAYAARDTWLPKQQQGQNAELSQEYTAKLFRDSAVLRMGYLNYMITTQSGHPDMEALKITMVGSQIGSQLDGKNANRNLKSTIEAAYALEPNNPDMKAIVTEYNSMAKRVDDLRVQYMKDNGGKDPYKDSIANPFGIDKPANAN